MLPRITICLGNRFTWGAIELTIESILARTTYPNYEILVIDNSQSPWNPKIEPARDLINCADDGSRIEYLREQKRRGNIRLVEMTEKYNEYGHGKNIKIALDNCDSPYVMLLSTGNEIRRSDWLTWFLSNLKDANRDMGIAIEKKPANHFDICWIAPVYWPNIMLLNMDIYRPFGETDDWSLKKVPFPEYKYRHIFEGMKPPERPWCDPPKVFLDTGWKLYERLNFEGNPKGLRIKKLLHLDKQMYFNFLGGMDTNAYRATFKHVVQNCVKIEEKLKILRKQ